MTRGSLPSRITTVCCFAAAMGWLEAVVVVYIRGLLGIAHTADLPAGKEVMHRLSSLPWLLPTEQSREAATIIMLATVGWLAARRPAARIGAFLLSFGVWDLAYYAGLLALVHWPTSLATMDVLFLIPPHPIWYQPVWVPITISLGLVALGLRLFLADKEMTTTTAP